MNPLLASEERPGFPMTILLRSTPLAAIWNTADLGKVLDDWVRRPLQVVYSAVPSVDARKSVFNDEGNDWYDGTDGYKTG